MIRLQVFVVFLEVVSLKRTQHNVCKMLWTCLSCYSSLSVCLVFHAYMGLESRHWTVWSVWSPRPDGLKLQNVFLKLQNVFVSNCAISLY